MSNMYNLPPEGGQETFWSMGHFPERFQFVIFRNWNRVPVERISRVLQTTPQQILLEAARLGLREYSAEQCNRWMQRGYLTIIRDNWHILNYRQLIELLDVDSSKLYRILTEEDFMFHKMGSFKPHCPDVYWSELSEDSLQKTARIAELIAPLTAGKAAGYEFDFINELENPAAQKLETLGGNSGELRLIYSYCAPFGDVLLPGTADPFPEGLLAQYQASGINAVWYPILLSSLTPWTGDEDYSENWQLRQQTLRKLVEKLARYNIKFFGYLNEPRALPREIADRHPGWCGPEHHDGSGRRALCINNEQVYSALCKGIHDLCSAVPGIGGFFTISMSENLTHCYSHFKADGCPVCSKLENPVENIVKVHQALWDGIKSAGSNARLIAWSWGWQKPWDLQILDKLPGEIELMCVSETELETDCCGIKGNIIDYSIAHPGPGPVAPRLWNYAKKQGRKIIAKIQLNATWELSCLPYIPVPQLAKQHLTNLEQCGIRDFMLSWTLGGAPGGNLPLTQQSVSAWCRNISEKHASSIEKACSCFSEGFSKFPFDNTFLIYRGPQNFGCANLLYAAPGNRQATMVGFCFDDLKTWTGNWHYPPEILEKVFMQMAEKWQQGLKILQGISSELADNSSFAELYNIAESAWCILQSSANQTAFYNRRDRHCGNPAEMPNLIENEIELAKLMIKCQQKDSRIGFEASNHYMFGENNLLEKIISCQYILNSYVQ